MRNNCIGSCADDAKLIKYNEAYFALRYTLMKQIADMDTMTKNEADKKMLAGLRRTVTKTLSSSTCLRMKVAANPSSVG